MSLVVISEILGLFLKTLTADEKNSLCNNKFSLQPMKMQSSKKQKTFANFFAAFLKSTSNFELLKKKMSLLLNIFQKFETAKDIIS